MALNFKTAALVLLLSILNHCNGVEINCQGLTTANCKTLFAETYDNEFKISHLEALRTNIKQFIQFNEKLIKIVPPGNDLENLKKDNQEIAAQLKILEENSGNVEKITKIIRATLGHLKNINSYANLSEKAEELFKNEKFLEGMLENLSKFIEKIAQEYIELMDGLREEDRKAFPVYNKINESMRVLRNEKDLSKQEEIFGGVFDMISENFETPYIQKIISQMEKAFE